MNLLRKPSCGARLCLRRQGRLANRRPLRHPRLAASATGGASAAMPRHAPRASVSPTAITKNSATANAVALFLAGAEGFEPSARGFGVDVEERKRERGKGGVARFLLQDENVRCWFGAFRFSRSKTRIESPLEISLRMSSLKSYICMYTEE